MGLLETPFRKPLGMYFHLWAPNRFDTNGDIARMKRLRIISIVVAVLFPGILAIAILRAREPRYEGRTLTEWV